MLYTLSETNKMEPGPTEAIFFEEPNFQGKAYIAYIGFIVDFGKSVLEIPDRLNDALKSVKTGDICRLVLFEDRGLVGETVSVPADSIVAQLPLGVTSFKVELDLDGKLEDEFAKSELDRITYERGLQECKLEREEFKEKLTDSEKLLEEYKNKLDACEQKGKTLEDELDKKKLEGEVKDIKDKLVDCEKKGKELKEQLDKSEQEKNDYKEKLAECEK